MAQMEMSRSNGGGEAPPILCPGPLLPIVCTEKAFAASAVPPCPDRDRCKQRLENRDRGNQEGRSDVDVRKPGAARSCTEVGEECLEHLASHFTSQQL